MQDKPLIAPVCTLLFNFTLPTGRSLEYFRGAINEKINPGQHPLFNNHEGDFHRHVHSLIHYKILDGRAAIVGVGTEAAQELTWFAGAYDGNLTINGETLTDASIHSLTTRFLPLEIAPELCFCYSTRNWVPFDSKEKRLEFEALSNDLARVQFLEKLLTNHIVTLYKALKAQELLAQSKIQVRILSGFEAPASVFFIHGNPQQTFAITFYTNARLCSDIGIGNAVSYAGGTIREE